MNSRQRRTTLRALLYVWRLTEAGRPIPRALLRRAGRAFLSPVRERAEACLQRRIAAADAAAAAQNLPF